MASSVSLNPIERLSGLVPRLGGLGQGVESLFDPDQVENDAESADITEADLDHNWMLP